jgi:hypothetical protein
MRRTAGGSHRLDRTVCRLRSLQRRQLFFHQGRRGALAARLDACEQITLKAVLVGREALEIGILRIRLGHQIEQVERASGGRRQIGGDGRHDASGRAGDDKDGVAVQVRPGLPSAAGCSCSPTVQRSPSL